VSRWIHDAADLACECWAFQFCCLFKRDPERAKEYLGALRCTIGQRRDLHAGSKSDGWLDQHFPEVFLGYGLVVAVALKYAELYEREVIYRHYLEARYNLNTGERFQRWMPRKVLSARLGIKPSTYATHLSIAKGWIHAALCLDIKELSLAREKAYESGSLENCSREVRLAN